MMETFFVSVLSNALVALLMAVGIVVLSVRLKRPGVLHLLWLVVLVKLFVPPVLAFSVLPAPESGGVTLEASAITLVPGDVDGAPEPLSTKAIVGWALVGVWALGSLSMLVVTLVRQRRFSILLARSKPAARELVQTIDALASAVGCRRRPRVLITDASVSPLVWSGLGRPRIVLPRRLMDELDERQRDTILAHELAHLKRGDDRVRWIELAAMIVFWWNPTTWIAARKLRDAEETCCDAIVAGALPGRIEDYARALVRTIRHLAAPEPSPLIAASGLGRPALIERRIVAMFSGTTKAPLRPAVRTVLIALAVAALGFSPMLTAREDTGDLRESGERTFTGEPISLTLHEADIRDVLTTFERLRNIEIEVDPDVEGHRITVELSDVPWDQALDMLLRMTGLSMTVENGVVHVTTGNSLDVVENLLERPSIAEEHDGRPYYRWVGTGDTITEPKRIDGPAPRYPEQARAEGINGAVELEVLIGEDGSVHRAEVVRSNADILSEAATEAVEQWTFEPATRDGVPVAVLYTLTINFRLE